LEAGKGEGSMRGSANESFCVEEEWSLVEDRSPELLSHILNMC
jgi:hypothetical protein